MVPKSIRIYKKNVLVKVLKKYKRRRCLWDITDPEYHNADARDKALGDILKKWQTIDLTATKEFVKMKILNMRTNYNRQRKKVETSLASGATGAEIYKPTLWYYPYLDFLSTNRNEKKSDDSAESDDDSDNEGMNDPLDTDSENNPYSQDHVEGSSAAFGSLVGVQLSKLPEMQRWIAEKLISDVLFHAKLSNLNETSKIKPKQIITTETESESDKNEVPMNADVVPNDDGQPGGELEGESFLVVEDINIEKDIKIEEDETENAVKFLQMY